MKVGTVDDTTVFLCEADCTFYCIANGAKISAATYKTISKKIRDANYKSNIEGVRVYCGRWLVEGVLTGNVRRNALELRTNNKVSYWEDRSRIIAESNATLAWKVLEGKIKELQGRQSKLRKEFKQFEIDGE